MPYFETGGKLIFFAHVPKAGGSSVEDYLAARFGPLAMLDREWERRWTAGGCRADSLRTSPQHVTAEDAARLLPRRPDWSFAVVRDPVARTVSEYRFQARARRRRRRLTRLGFSTWLRAVLAAARRDPTILDNHLRPQSELVPEDAEIFRIEDGFASLIARIDAVTGSTAPDLEMGHALKSSVELPVQPSARDLRLMAAFYAEDYARFDYPLPDPATAPASPLDLLRHLPGRPLAPLAAWTYFSGRI